MVCVSIGAKRHIDKQDGCSIRNNQTTLININSKIDIDKKDIVSKIEMLDSLTYSMTTCRKHRDGYNQQTQEKEDTIRYPLNDITTLGSGGKHQLPPQSTHKLTFF